MTPNLSGDEWDDDLALPLNTIKFADSKRIVNVLQGIPPESFEYAAPLKERLLLTQGQLKRAVDALPEDQKPEPAERQIHSTKGRKFDEKYGS